MFPALTGVEGLGLGAGAHFVARGVGQFGVFLVAGAALAAGAEVEAGTPGAVVRDAGAGFATEVGWVAGTVLAAGTAGAAGRTAGAHFVTGAPEGVSVLGAVEAPGLAAVVPGVLGVAEATVLGAVAGLWPEVWGCDALEVEEAGWTDDGIGF